MANSGNGETLIGGKASKRKDVHARARLTEFPGESLPMQCIGKTPVIIGYLGAYQERVPRGAINVSD